MLADIIERRLRALINAWVQNPLVQVQVESPNVLPNLVFLDDAGAAAGATVGRVGRRAETNCAMVKGMGSPDTAASVWVRASYSSYRNAYLAFVREAYGVTAAPAQLGGYDVDHLLNRARAPLPTTFVRIEAVPSTANQAWGRLFEKASSNPQFHANQARERRTMSWMICAKLAGEMPPSGPDDTIGIDRLVRHFRSLGIPDTETRQGLVSMLEFAYKFR